MKVLIVDDESPARERLDRLIGDIEGYKTIGEASNGKEAIDVFNSTDPDIVLLDIRMPVMDGIETAHHLMELEQPPAIIFTTAYDDHAIAAFETHAVDYLLKPIRAERLEDALQSAQQTTRAQVENISSSTETENSRQHICIRNRGNLELVPIDDIYYFQAEHKYVNVRHINGEALIEESLIKLEEEFAGSFLRVHRNALVSLNKIHGMDKISNGCHKITFKNIEEKIEISRRHLAAIRRLIKGKA